MRLYHFTDIANLRNKGTILRDGLLIPPEPLVCEGLWAAAVWLTANPEPVCWWEKGSFKDDCRITVEIRNGDRRLRQCKAHLRPTPIHDVMQTTSDTNGLRWEDWYFFFGNIPLRRFRAISFAPGDPGPRVRVVFEIGAGTRSTLQ
jgi:hypothetical protein